MLGAIIGDMVGSIYEFDSIKSKKFDIYNPRMYMTDDSLLTIAVAKVLMDNYPIMYSEGNLKKIQDELVIEFVETWRNHKGAGFGGRFFDYCVKADQGIVEPYYSCGNGSAMRISPVG